MSENESPSAFTTLDDNNASLDFPSVVNIDSMFLYQNNVTGQVSTTHLSTRQLCRILCPATIIGSSMSPIRHLTPDTNLLMLEPYGNYCVAGWTPARDIPIIREAITLWYYFCSDKTVATAINTANGSAVSLAVSCRDLAAVLKEKENNYGMYFSSVLTNSEWKAIDQLPHLQTALAAFDETSPLFQANVETQKNLVADDIGIDITHEVQRELEAFLSSTASTTLNINEHSNENDDRDKDESYESDLGTRYVKDSRTGNWVHEALVTASSQHAPQVSRDPELLSRACHSSAASNSAKADNAANKRKQKKAKFSAKKGRCWIYVTGLPVDCTVEEVAERFAKAGLLDLDPETQRPKIKLYRHKDANHPHVGKPKGDASICYARPESISLAVTLLDGTPFRPYSLSADDAHLLMTVQSAKFEQHGEQFDTSRGRTSNAKRKVAKLATMQAMDWDDGAFNGHLTGGRKGLRIIVLKHIFDSGRLVQLSEEEQDRILGALEHDLRLECERWGVVEKLTFFSQNSDGVVVAKFTQPGAASDAVKELNGRLWKERRIEACFWDGVTDFTVKDEAKEAKDLIEREEEFGTWLESQELPKELQLNTGTE